MAATNTSDEEIHLAMIGMVEGNGHPYSWSAIVNGYDPDEMADCPYPVIPEYLGEQDDVGIPNASVTHIWTDNPEDAEDVARAAFIDNIVDDPTEVIGEVDGVIIPTDDGDNHAARVGPFIDAELPIFVDKPLATNIDDLKTFVEWYNNGYQITSSSALRYAPEITSLVKNIHSLGQIRWITNATHKTWKRYGIHRLEPVVRFLGPGFETVECTSNGDTEIYSLTHQSGPTITVGVRNDLRGGSGRLTVYGTDDGYTIESTDTYTSFRQQLLSILDFIRTGKQDVPFEETVDLMAGIIAGIRSRKENRCVDTSEIYEHIPIDKP